MTLSSGLAAPLADPANGVSQRILAIDACVRLGPLLHPERPFLVGVLAGRSCLKSDLRLGAGFEVIDDAGHFPHLQAPETLVRLARDFLDG